MAQSPRIALLGSEIQNLHSGIGQINACKSYEMHEAIRTNLNDMPCCWREEDIILLSSRNQPQYLRSFF